MGCVYPIHYNSLVHIFQVLHFSDNHFDTRIILAAAVHAMDPAYVNETEANPDGGKPTQRTLTEDEDPNEEVANDLDVIAEVKLPLTILKFNLLTLTFPSPSSHC